VADDNGFKLALTLERTTV